MYICDYNTIVDTFVTALTAANTTTASFDLSYGLDKRVKTVSRDDLDIKPEFLPNYPVVNVRLIDRREYQGAMTGSNFNREIFLDMKVEAIYDNFLSADTNLYKLVSNVEANLRYNSTLWKYDSGGFKILHITPKQTVFRSKYKGGADTFNRSGEIKVEVKGLLKSI